MTGYEMFLECKNSNMLGLSSEKWAMKNFEVLSQNIHELTDNSLLFCASAKFDELEELYDYAFILQKNRFLLARKKAFGVEFRIVPYNSVSDFSFTTFLYRTKIIMKSINQEIIIDATIEVGKNIEKTLHEMRSTNRDNDNRNEIESILKYKELFDLGIISLDEYEKLKNKFLEKIRTKK